MQKADELILQSNAWLLKRLKEIPLIDTISGFDSTDDERSVELRNNEDIALFKEIPLIDNIDDFSHRVNNFAFESFSNKRRQELFKKYKAEQEDRIISCKREVEREFGFQILPMRNQKWQVKVQSDSNERCDLIEISSDEIDKLRPETDINDGIIQSYLKIIQNRVLLSENEDKTFIFSSFFMEKLLGDFLKEEMFLLTEFSNLTASKIRAKVCENYKNVKKWTKKVDIFDKKYIVIPINAFRHWWCLIVVNPGGLVPGSMLKPAIINCDSLYEEKPFIAEAIREYLHIELDEKKQIHSAVDMNEMPCYQPLLPRQTNNHDCGLYMLTYIENLLRDPQSLQGLEDLKARDKLKLFPRSLAISLRERLRRLFIGLKEAAGDLERQKQVFFNHSEERERLLRMAISREAEFDEFNEKEYAKFKSVQKKQNTEWENPEEDFKLRIKFYLDPEVNFYERDKN